MKTSSSFKYSFLYLTSLNVTALCRKKKIIATSILQRYNSLRVFHWLIFVSIGNLKFACYVATEW